MFLFFTGFLSCVSAPVIQTADIEKAKTLFYSGDLDAAADILKPYSGSDNPESVFYLGLIYSNANWKYHDPQKAFRFFMKSANKGYAPSALAVGQAYESGDGVETDLLKAIDWRRKAQSLESKPTLLKLYRQTSKGFVEQSAIQMIKQLEDNEKNGDIEAAYQLARVYDDGLYVKRDFSMALFWYEKAAENGHTHSQLLCGYFYCRGIGVPQNDVIADQWLLKTGSKITCTNP